MWIHSFSILGNIADSVWNAKAQPQQIAYFLEERDDLRVKIYS